MSLAHPLPGYTITTPFNGYPGHRGADFAAPTGTPILASHDGRVRMAGWVGGAFEKGGNLVYLTAHDNSYETSYQHMVSAPIVSVGQNVSKGQVLGYVGSTGYSFGPHLHFELWLGGPAWSSGSRAVDPAPHIDQIQPTPESLQESNDMKVITGGTVALIGEYETSVYTSMAGAQGFSIEANSKAYGNVSGFTGDQVTTLINEAQARRSNLIKDIVKDLQPIIATEVAKALENVTGVTATIDVAAIAKAVNDDAALRLKS